MVTVRTKKGEVVGPAGGETGGPRCLAEDRKLLRAALFRYDKTQHKKLTFSKNAVKQKNEKIKNSLRDFRPPDSYLFSMFTIQLLVIKCKQKIVFLRFFV